MNMLSPSVETFKSLQKMDKIENAELSNNAANTDKETNKETKPTSDSNLLSVEKAANLNFNYLLS